MPQFAIARTAKQKGGSVASSGHHNDRTRETLNADPSRKDENRTLIGDDRNVREIVTEVIQGQGGKPRSDSVEAVEMMLTATRSFFTDERDEIDMKKVDQFVERATAFLEDPRSGGLCVKAVLHLDERTPHIQAHKVPIDPQGKLNCKHYFGGREKMERFQDLYHEYMKPLGLERGERGSRARHTDIQKFYAAITEEHELKINYDRLPDPPLFRTKEAIKKYKKEVIKSVNAQVREPLQVLHHQARLTREETAKREASELRAEERIQQAERITALAMRQNDTLSHENQVLKKQVKELEKVNGRLQGELSAERVTSTQLRAVGSSLYDRLRDIPIPDVMEKMGYGREQQEGHFVYRNAQQQIVLAVNDKNELINRDGAICRNSLDAVMHMRNVNEKQNISPTDALHWLADNFGSSRAIAAIVVKQEQYSSKHLIERSLEMARQDKEREFAQQTLSPGREASFERLPPGHDQPQQNLPQHDDHDRDFGFSR
jgi:hypothetical protein